MLTYLGCEGVGPPDGGRLANAGLLRLVTKKIRRPASSLIFWFNRLIDRLRTPPARPADLAARGLRIVRIVRIVRLVPCLGALWLATLGCNEKSPKAPPVPSTHREDAATASNAPPTRSDRSRTAAIITPEAQADPGSPAARPPSDTPEKRQLDGASREELTKLVTALFEDLRAKGESAEAAEASGKSPDATGPEGTGEPLKPPSELADLDLSKMGSPLIERIETSAPDEARVSVRLPSEEGTSDSSSEHFELVLRRSDTSWQIVTVRRLQTSADAKNPPDWSGDPVAEGDLQDELGPEEANDYPAYLERLFAESRKYPSGSETAHLQTRALGRLAFSGGRIVVGDPSHWSSAYVPLERKLPPGSLRVDVATSTFDDGTRVSGLRFSTGKKATRYVVGSRLQVESGTVAVVGEDVLQRSSPRDRERLALEFAASGKNAALMPIDPQADGHQIAISKAGFGSGEYPVFWGLTESGEVAELIVDFRFSGI